MPNKLRKILMPVSLSPTVRNKWLWVKMGVVMHLMKLREIQWIHPFRVFNWLRLERWPRFIRKRVMKQERLTWWPMKHEGLCPLWDGAELYSDARSFWSKTRWQGNCHKKSGLPGKGWAKSLLGLYDCDYSRPRYFFQIGKSFGEFWLSISFIKNRGTLV